MLFTILIGYLSYFQVFKAEAVKKTTLIIKDFG